MMHFNYAANIKTDHNASSGYKQYAWAQMPNLAGISSLWGLELSHTVLQVPGTEFQFTLIIVSKVSFASTIL